VIVATGTGSVVDRLGVRLSAVSGADATALLGVALRRNPLRAQLLVSRALGKHVPTDPRLVRAAGLLLGGQVADALAGRQPRPLPVAELRAAAGGDRAAAAALHAALVPEGPVDALVLGFAETATALGHCVAEAVTADYLHSTRREVPGVAPAGAFTEEHSHAIAHDLLPTDPDVLRGGRPLVLVDDELSTGRTALNTITALHAAAPREHYVLAALVDARPPDSRLVEAVGALGARLDVVALPGPGSSCLPTSSPGPGVADRDRPAVRPAPAQRPVGHRADARPGPGCGPWTGGRPAGRRAARVRLGAARPVRRRGGCRAAGLDPDRRSGPWCWAPRS
jgi:hypothetical protein